MAFLEKLPTVDKRQYAEIVKASVAAGGYHHMQGGTANLGRMNMENMNMNPDTKLADPPTSDQKH